MPTYSYKLDRGGKYQVLFHKQYLPVLRNPFSKTFFCLDRRKKKGNPYASAKAQKTGWLKSLFTVLICL